LFRYSRSCCGVLLFFFLSNSFGGDESRFPHPDMDFKGFVRMVESENARHGKVWDPINKRPRHWIKRSKLRAMGPLGCSVS
jgi:hypothetical protein